MRLHRFCLLISSVNHAKGDVFYNLKAHELRVSSSNPPAKYRRQRHEEHWTSHKRLHPLHNPPPPLVDYANASSSSARGSGSAIAGHKSDCACVPLCITFLSVGFHFLDLFIHWSTIQDDASCYQLCILIKLRNFLHDVIVWRICPFLHTKCLCFCLNC
jgi:hypothetical protein